MTKNNLIIIVILLVTLCIVVLEIFINVKNVENKQNVETTSKSETENEIINQTIVTEHDNERKDKEENNMYSSGIHHATIEIKEYGTIKIELDADTAPITVANFAKLVNEGFYNGLTFHRIIDGFMIQGGDPLGNGTGGSEENIKGEFKINGVENNISHKRGVISMARAISYNSASSQFFIVHEDSTFLDGQYAGFGKVTEGIEIVDKICEDTKVEDNNGTVLKTNQPIIEKITMDN